MVFANDDWFSPVPELGMSIGEALLLPHLSYLAPLRRVLDDPALGQAVTGMAHITGGGLLENIPRVLPPGFGVDLDAATWEIPPIFTFLQARGHVDWREMQRVFNLGIGYVLMARAEEATSVVAALNEQGAGARVIGTVVARGEGEAVRVEGLPV